MRFDELPTDAEFSFVGLPHRRMIRVMADDNVNACYTDTCRLMLVKADAEVIELSTE